MQDKRNRITDMEEVKKEKLKLAAFIEAEAAEAAKKEAQKTEGIHILNSHNRCHSRRRNEDHNHATTTNLASKTSDLNKTLFRIF